MHNHTYGGNRPAIDVIIDEHLSTLKENLISLTMCVTTRGKYCPSIDRWTVQVNRLLVQRRFQYLIFEESKYRVKEEHREPVDGSRYHTVCPSLDS